MRTTMWMLVAVFFPVSLMAGSDAGTILEDAAPQALHLAQNYSGPRVHIAQATPATSVVEHPAAAKLQAAINRVVAISHSNLGPQEMIRQLRLATDQTFEWPSMCQFALGFQWRQRTPEEKEEFSRLYGDLIARTFSEKIREYNIQSSPVTGVLPGADANSVRVQVSVQGARSANLYFDMTNRGGDWRVYDASFESFRLNMYFHDKFQRVASGQGGFNALIQRLRSGDLFD